MIDLIKATRVLSNEEMYAIDWFKKHGFEGMLEALPQISVLILTPSPSIWLPKAYTHIFRTLYVSPF